MKHKLCTCLSVSLLVYHIDSFVCVTVFCVYLHCRSCEVLEDLPSESQDTTAEVKAMTEYACRIEPKLLHTKERRQKTRERIVNQGKDIVKSIQELRQELDDMLERVEGHTSHALTTLLQATDDNLVGDIKHCDKLQDDLNAVTDLERRDLEGVGKSFAFMCVEHCNRVIWEAGNLMSNGNRKEFELKFEADEGLKKTLSSLDTLGHLNLMSMTEDSPDGADDSSEMFVVKEMDKYNVDTADDKDVCGIRGVCGLPNGDIVITDCSNNKVKLLDEKFKVLDQCKIPPHPRDICCLDDGTVFVTVCDQERWREIQKLQIKARKIEPKNTIKLDHDCYGLARYNDQLFVSSHTALYVYTMDGELVKKLYEDTTEMFTIWRIAVADDGERIYVADYSNDRLITLNKEGEQIASLSDNDLEGPSGICVAGNGSVLICGEHSNAVLQVDKEGKQKLVTLVNMNTTAKRAEVLWFDRDKRQLIVGQDNNSILVVTVSK